MEIPQVTIPNGNVRNIPNIYTPNWLRTEPVVPFPNVPVTQQVGVPVIQYPGCVTAHESNREQLKKDDPDKVLVFCDAGMPSFDGMDYNPDELEYVAPPVEAPKLEPPPQPEIDPPEIPPTGDLQEKEGCPTEAQELTAPIDSVTADGKQKIVEYRLVGEQCIAVKEDLDVGQQIIANIPSAGAVTTTAGIAVIATSSAIFAKPLADIAMRAFKPIFKQIAKKIQGLLGKTSKTFTKQELLTNSYRHKKGLAPVKPTRRY